MNKASIISVKDASRKEDSMGNPKVEIKEKQIDLITSQLIKDERGNPIKRREDVFEMLHRSVSRVKDATSGEASPIYKVAHWLSRHKHQLETFKNRNEIAKKISLDTGLQLYTVVSILQHQPFDVPDKLKGPMPPEPFKRSFDGELIKIPPGVKELFIRSSNFELTLKFA